MCDSALTILVPWILNNLWSYSTRLGLNEGSSSSLPLVISWVNTYINYSLYNTSKILILCPSLTDLVPNAPGRHVQTSQFLLEVVDILLDYIRKTNDRTTKVRQM